MDLESVPEGNAFKIAGTLQGFAAEKAGLRAGDLITAIDGQPASNFTWEQAIRLLHQDGQEYWLTIQRDKEIKEIHLVIPEKKI
jgi:S1-C subfamily serine protease